MSRGPGLIKTGSMSCHRSIFEGPPRSLIFKYDRSEPQEGSSLLQSGIILRKGWAGKGGRGPSFPGYPFREPARIIGPWGGTSSRQKTREDRDEGASNERLETRGA